MELLNIQRSISWLKFMDYTDIQALSSVIDAQASFVNNTLIPQAKEELLNAYLDKEYVHDEMDDVETEHTADYITPLGGYITALGVYLSSFQEDYDNYLDLYETTGEDGKGTSGIFINSGAAVMRSLALPPQKYIIEIDYQNNIINSGSRAKGKVTGMLKNKTKEGQMILATYRSLTIIQGQLGDVDDAVSSLDDSNQSTIDDFLNNSFNNIKEALADV